MKTGIWIGCIFGAGVLMVVIQRLAGAMLGPLFKTLLVVGACVLARTLCKLYDKRSKK